MMEVYGFFPGGDPRKFTPDPECCSKEEIQRWKEACDLWNSGKEVYCEGSHIWITDEKGRVIGHGTNARFGLGTYICEYDEEEFA